LGLCDLLLAGRALDLVDDEMKTKKHCRVNIRSWRLARWLGATIKPPEKVEVGELFLVDSGCGYWLYWSIDPEAYRK
jgi:hypothetical protein